MSGASGGSSTRTQQPVTPTHVTVLRAEIRKPSPNAPGAPLVVTPRVVATDPQPAGAGGADGVVAGVATAIGAIGATGPCRTAPASASGVSTAMARPTTAASAPAT